MEYNEQINVEHGGGGGVNQHYQQHFHQHYTAADNSNRITPHGTPVMTSRFPHVPLVTTIQHQPLVNLGPLAPAGAYETHREESSAHHHGPMSSHESHSQVVHSQTVDPVSGNPVSQVEKHEKQSSKKTTQTTTTTTTTNPVLITTNGEQHQALLPVNAIIVEDSGNMSSSGGRGNRNDDDLERSYTIQVEHHNQPQAFNWSNADIYLHIFLTFWLGVFAATLFFDGILRSIVYLYVLRHTAMSPLIFILNIVFSIAMLAFIIWFLTICWRWWRNKSLSPINYAQYQRTVGPRQRQSQNSAHGYVFLAGCLLIISFLIFLILGIVDINYKHRQEIYNHQFKPYTRSMFMGDYIIFGFRCFIWIVAIIVTFLLSRDYLMKYCCPSKRIKIDKEKPTTVYEVRT